MHTSAQARFAVSTHGSIDERVDSDLAVWNARFWICVAGSVLQRLVLAVALVVGRSPDLGFEVCFGGFAGVDVAGGGGGGIGGGVAG